MGQAHRLVDTRLVPFVEARQPAHETKVGVGIVGRPAPRPRSLRPPHLRLDRAYDLCRHLILQIEYVLDSTFEVFGPDMRRRCGVDELSGDADARSRLAHAAFQHKANAKFAADLSHIDGAALVGKGRVARDDVHVPVVGQARDDVLNHAVGEIVLIAVSTHVLKRQDCDRQPVGKREFGRLRGRHGRRFGLRSVQQQATNPDWPGDVLELLLALVGKADIEAAFDVLLHARRHANAAWRRKSLQPGSHVHTFTEDIVVLDDNVANMDADAEFDTPVRRDVGIARRHAALDVNGTADRIDDAGEFGQQAVARRLDQPSMMLGELGIEQRGAMGFQLSDGALLIGADQPAITGNIGCEHGRKPPVQTLGCQGCLRVVAAEQFTSTEFYPARRLSITQAVPPCAGPRPGGRDRRAGGD